MDHASRKSKLRKALRQTRREHVAAQPDAIRALLFHRPPAPLLSIITPDAVIGVYHALPDEAPAGGYARFFHEAGHRVALPYFAANDASMTFRDFVDPLGESELETGPYSIRQPDPEAQECTPDILFVPLVGFTERLERLGQGGGHYDRWLATHPQATAIGLAWDAQLVESLPVEPHDMALDAVVTPTRLYGMT
ncbi:MAG: 5-formyltetrahydrofolate cyclo-ligase [Erythrobacter sp.]